MSASMIGRTAHAPRPARLAIQALGATPTGADWRRL